MGMSNQVVSLSGGKDSTAMLLMMLERGVIGGSGDER